MNLLLRSVWIVLALTFSVSLVSCKHGTGEKVQEAGEAVVEAAREATEEAGKAVKEAGEATERTWDAKVAGTDFHATGTVKCRMDKDADASECPFGVIRRENGTADVHVTKSDGRTRVIFFEKGKAIGYDQSQADPGEFRASHQGDTWIIYIGEERYDLVEAIVYGG
jgi:predicted small secreted protein/cold shock CspA family protein